MKKLLLAACFVTLGCSNGTPYSTTPPPQTPATPRFTIGDVSPATRENVVYIKDNETGREWLAVTRQSGGVAIVEITKKEESK